MLHIILFPAITYAILAFIRLNFLSIRTFNTKFDALTSRHISTQASSAALFKMFLSCTALVAAVPALLQGSTGPFATEFQVVAGLLVAALVLHTTGSTAAQFTPIAVLFTLCSSVLLLTANLLQFYIVIEITAYLNLLFLAMYGLTASPQRSQQNVTALLVSFVLNFVASLCLYSLCLVQGYELGDLTTTYWAFTTSFANSVAALFIVVKLGTGPWLAGSAVTYTGYSLQYLIIYTAATLFFVIPSLFAVASAAPVLIFATTAMLTLLYVSQTLHTVTTMKALFAYSTVIVYTYLLLISLH